MNLRITRLFAVACLLNLLLAGCQSVDSAPPAQPGPRPGEAVLSGRRFSNDECGTGQIYVVAIDSQVLPNGVSRSGLRTQYPLTPGRHEIVFEIQREMGWSNAPFHVRATVVFEAAAEKAYLPCLSLPDPATRAKARTTGELWIQEQAGGKAVSDRVRFDTVGYAAPTMMYY